MQKLVFTNGNGLEIDLTAGNFGITKWAGLSNTSLNIQTQQVPFEDGGVFLDALMEQREIELTVAIYDGNNLELRYQKKRELISALNPKAGEGVLVYTNDYLTRQIRAVPQLPIFENKNSNDGGTLKASVVFSCPSPYWEDVEETEVVIEDMTSQTIENTGDVEINPILQIAGNFDGVEVYNNTTGKKLIINDNIDGKLIIDTGIGTKSVKVQSYNFSQSISNEAINDCCYYNKIDKVVIVGDNNDCYLLNRNNVIEKLSIVEGNSFLGVASDGENIIVCTSNNIFMSNDCETWQNVYTGNGIEGVKYNENLSLFIAYGSNIVTSSDGESWTDIAITSPVKDIAYSDTLIMGIGNNYVVTSSDGETWTDGTFNYIGISITYNENDNSFDVLCSNTTYVQVTEDNGATWENENIQNFTEKTAIFYSPYTEGFIVVGQGGRFYKQNALTIKTLENAESTNFIGGKHIGEFKCDLIFGQHILVKTNYAVFNILKSFPPHNIYNLIKSDDKYVVGTKDGYIFYSLNGLIWKQAYYVGSASNFMQVDYSTYSKKYVAIYGGGNIVLTSSNGITWNRETIPSGVGSLYDVACSPNSNNVYICGRFYDLYTLDNSTWRLKPKSWEERRGSVFYDENLKSFLETGDRGICYKMIENGNFYQDVIIDVSNLNTNFVGIAYSPVLDMYVAVGYIMSNYEPRSFYIKGDNDYAILYTGVLTVDNYALGIIWHNTLNAFLLWTSTGKIYISYDGFNYDLYATYEDINILTEDYLATNNTGYINVLEEETNKISKLSSDSDMNFTLALGENKLSIYYGSGELNCKLLYRNKYIGV